MDFAPDDAVSTLAGLAGQVLRDGASAYQPSPGITPSATGERFDRRTWTKLGAAGVLGVGLAPDVGGEGLGEVAVHLVLEQVGRLAAYLPTLETLVLGGATVDRFGSSAQRAAWLPGVVNGTALLTAALDEPGSGDPCRPRTLARREDGRWVVTGEKSRVGFAAEADRMIVAATDEHGDVIVLLVDPQADGVMLAPQAVTGARPASFVRFDGVTIGDSEQLGAGGSAGGTDIVTDLVLRAEAGLASMQSGVCAGALQLTSEHVRTREQFGRPIGDFQAVRQRLADAWIDAEAVRLTSLRAAYHLDASTHAANDPVVREAVGVAKWWAAEAGHRVLHTAHHLHGGVGIDLSYPLHRYFELAKQIEFSLGNAEEHLAALGRLLVEDERAATGWD